MARRGDYNMRVTQTWQPILLPRCGTCEVFGGGNSNFTTSNLTPSCVEIKDITELQEIRTHEASQKGASPFVFPAASSFANSLDGSIGSRTSTPTANEVRTVSCATVTAAGAKLFFHSETIYKNLNFIQRFSNIRLGIISHSIIGSPNCRVHASSGGSAARVVDQTHVLVEKKRYKQCPADQVCLHKSGCE